MIRSPAQCVGVGSGQGDGWCPVEHLCPSVQMALWRPGDEVHMHFLITVVMLTNPALSPPLSLLSLCLVPVSPVCRCLVWGFAGGVAEGNSAASSPFIPFSSRLFFKWIKLPFCGAPCEALLSAVSTVEGAKLVTRTNDTERLKGGQEYLTLVFLRTSYPTGFRFLWQFKHYPASPKSKVWGMKQQRQDP